ncbi:sensor histidine kinase [Streptomyces sp. H27-D2]|uniref:sensor histidine kinase n=1 Tax=Streptomyces sp. H27-D2 TaxID=3046304 RepID=UPI002DB840DC|nr:HAMP domain-containing sensor histidine kinase [Streptomyces sp. H27-D2]MEC4015662.1 HAMP domain-containing sensor histidine kinase [Streptomyces sp. H27-D2]
MRRPRFHALPLRSRLTILTAAAVAVAVAASAFACWFITRHQLTEQLDKSLSSTSAISSVQRVLDQYGCLSEPLGKGSDQQPAFVNPMNSSVQLVQADGSRCWVTGTEALPVVPADTSVATGRSDSTLHDVTTEDGTKMRVYTQPIQIVGSHQQLALSIARPLSEITGPLNTLALVLLMVAGVGVLGAATAGLWVARAGLKPVDQLTEAVEHIARTDDLAVRIPVEGDDEIARLSAAFNSMTEALASSRERQQQLIADAGHELRTPLTSLRTNIDLLVRSEESGRSIPEDDRRALLTSVRAQMGELAALIGDLQELSRPDAAAGSAPVPVIALHELAARAVQRARLRGSGIEITAAFAPWYVRAEPAALERALVNLLDNAVKFSPQGGVVEVALHGGELTVRDHGPGIPAEELPHVFERFWRSPSARSLPGSGLGLSIVAHTVQQAGGEVALRAAYGGGAIAAVRLPGAPVAPPESRPRASTAPVE